MSVSQSQFDRNCARPSSCKNDPFWGYLDSAPSSPTTPMYRACTPVPPSIISSQAPYGCIRSVSAKNPECVFANSTHNRSNSVHVVTKLPSIPLKSSIRSSSVATPVSNHHSRCGKVQDTSISHPLHRKQVRFSLPLVSQPYATADKSSSTQHTSFQGSSLHSAPKRSSNSDPLTLVSNNFDRNNSFADLNSLSPSSSKVNFSPKLPLPSSFVPVHHRISAAGSHSRLLKLTGTLGKQSAVFLVDSGATANFVSSSFVAKHQLSFTVTANFGCATRHTPRRCESIPKSQSVPYPFINDHEQQFG